LLSFLRKPTYEDQGFEKVKKAATFSGFTTKMGRSVSSNRESKRAAEEKEATQMEAVSYHVH
jgi:hypothetical protein